LQSSANVPDTYFCEPDNVDSIVTTSVSLSFPPTISELEA